MKKVLFAALVLLVAITGLTHAQPVPDDEKIPVDIRRTTLVVRDIEKSLPLYRDALGLKVIYDQLIGGGKDKDGKVTPPTIRLVLLRANDQFIGAIGLMQRLNQPMLPPITEFKRPNAGGMIMVINAKDLDTRWEKIKATPNIKIDTEPYRIEYPGPNNTVIPVLFSSVFDNDGNFIEINKLLGTAAGASTTTTPPAEKK
ncbi:MAG: VOC family protein [Burkholderiales bacterium]|jgi:catechol 2,3-dioxygenase-like lactoylglutathione lyase family enzyme|nr:VOC family protein [Betaproteobacteria bacterium]